MNLLYVSPNRRETVAGWVLLALTAIPGLFLPVGDPAALFAVSGVLAVAVILIFRKFLAESFSMVRLETGSFLWKSFLFYCVSQVCRILQNDLFFYLSPNYFTYTITGPVFLSPFDAAVASMAAENLLLAFLGFAVLLPLVQEVLLRGIFFRFLYSRSGLLAYVLTTLLFALMHTLPYITGADPVFLLILFLQYVPAGIYLTWAYTSTETIFAPIAIHMAIYINLINSTR